MTTELWLLRHAHAARPEHIADFDRPLSERGKAEAEAAGRWLHKKSLVPDCIVCSPALRTLSTAKIICQQLNLPESLLITDARIYDAADDQVLITVLSEKSGACAKILLVGHNPALTELLVTLCQNPRLELSTAALALVKLPKNRPLTSAKAAKLLAFHPPLA